MLNQPDCPKVIRQIRVGQVRVGHREVSASAPVLTPGVSDEETLLGIVISDSHYGMSAQDLLTRPRHWYETCSRHFRRLEALVDGETKYKRVSGSKASTELIERCDKPAV